MVPSSSKSLSIGFTVCCLIDVFGVFPVIALARAIVECGWIGVPLAIGVFCLQTYTALLLGKCWIMAEKIDGKLKFKTRYPYAALAELTFGKKLAAYISFILNMTIFGAMVPHIIVASQNLQLLSIYLLPNRFDFSACVMMIIIGLALCPLVCLGSPKDMKWLTMISMSTVVLVSLLTWICLIQEPGHPVVIPEPSWDATAIALGILAFQFDIHPVVLTIQMDMKDKRNLGFAVLLGFLVTGVLSLTTVSLAYQLEGIAARYNILQGLEPSPLLYTTLTLVTLQIILSTVVGSSALFQQVEHKLSIPADFGWKRCLVRSSIVMGAVIVAESIPRLDIIMGLIGGCMTGQLMFVWPVLFYRRLRGMIASSAAGILSTDYQCLSVPVVPEPSCYYGSISATTALVLSPPRDSETFEDVTLASKLPTKTKLHGERKSHISSLISMDLRSDDMLPTTLKVTLFLIAVFGVGTAILSTFYSLSEAIQYSDFTPPCLVNFTLYFM